MPSEAEILRLEADLLQRFNAHMSKLVELYLFAVKLDINDLQNTAIDRIQDGYHEYGTVFGPGLLVKIFNNTVKGNKLRELCLAANLIHIDRGCHSLRNELIQASVLTNDFLRRCSNGSRATSLCLVVARARDSMSVSRRRVLPVSYFLRC
jgi:hypothetical protein